MDSVPKFGHQVFISFVLNCCLKMLIDFCQTVGFSQSNFWTPLTTEEKPWPGALPTFRWGRILDPVFLLSDFRVKNLSHHKQLGKCDHRSFAPDRKRGCKTGSGPRALQRIRGKRQSSTSFCRLLQNIFQEFDQLDRTVLLHPRMWNLYPEWKTARMLQFVWCKGCPWSFERSQVEPEWSGIISGTAMSNTFIFTGAVLVARS